MGRPRAKGRTRWRTAQCASTRHGGEPAVPPLSWAETPGCWNWAGVLERERGHQRPGRLRFGAQGPPRLVRSETAETPEQAGRRCCPGAEGPSAAQRGSGFWVQRRRLWACRGQVQAGTRRPHIWGASVITASPHPSSYRWMNHSICWAL